MILVGLTGGIGHGKTTFGAYLGAQASSFAAYESSDLIMEVANALRGSGAFPSPSDSAAVNRWLRALPDILAQQVRRDAPFESIALTEDRAQHHPEYYEKLFEYLQLMHAQPELQSGPITRLNKPVHRAILQWLGGYLAKTVDGRIWYDEIVRRIDEATPVEIAIVGGVRFPADAKSLRDAGGTIIAVRRPSLEERDSTDLTERERSAITPDTTVLNNGSLPDLESAAHRVFVDLKAGTLQSQYSAAKH